MPNLGKVDMLQRLVEARSDAFAQFRAVADRVVSHSVDLSEPVDNRVKTTLTRRVRHNFGVALDNECLSWCSLCSVQTLEVDRSCP
jgi:hypothetical protein